MRSLAPYAKAIVAGIVAAVGAGATAAIDDRITIGEWWMMAAAGATALGAVFGVPNRGSGAADRDPASPSGYSAGTDAPAPIKPGDPVVIDPAPLGHEQRE